MGEIKDEINWENFLDNCFDLYRPTVDKKEYQNGLTIDYSKNDIYVWCDLDKDKTRIKKLAFGRYINDNSDRPETNWIKGVFINDEHSYTTFLQTSFDSEHFDKSNTYNFDFDNLNKNVVARFLQTPCMTGWTEEEYILGQDTFYKVIVRLDNAQWTVSLMDIGEQDIPMLTDKLDIWLRTKIGDAFWNNTKRKINKIKVTPMSGKTSKGVTE
jgi:hypothetical protein